MDGGYDSPESFIYWRFIDIKEWCQLKSKIPVNRGGVSDGYRKIKCLQALAWRVIDLTLRCKSVDQNKCKTDIVADTIEESRIDFEYAIYGKGELSNTKEFSHEKYYQWEDSIYNYFTSRKYSRNVPLFYFIIKYIQSTEGSENRYVQIIY